MFTTKGISTIASVTELRSKTNDLINHASSSGEGIMIQKNNAAYGVLLSPQQHEEYEERLGALQARISRLEEQVRQCGEEPVA